MYSWVNNAITCTAMFEDEERAKHSVRFSFNEEMTEQQIKYIVAEIHKIYHKFKEES